MDIKSYVKNGSNEIILERSFYQDRKVYDVLFGENVYETEKNKLTYNVELESIYVVGDFGVLSKSGYTSLERNALHTDGPFMLVEEPETVKTGDLTQQGFCFFAGSVTLNQEININRDLGARLMLKLGRPHCAMAKVYINDRHVKNLLWRPFDADISEYVRQGANKLSIRLIGGNRNLLGPHHHVKGEVYNVGPLSFTGKWSWVERETEAQVITEKDRSMNFWKDGYCLVKFGLQSE